MTNSVKLNAVKGEFVKTYMVSTAVIGTTLNVRFRVMKEVDYGVEEAVRWQVMRPIRDQLHEA